MLKFLFKCVICKKEVTEYGNSPYPIKKTGHACDECNINSVIPTRLKLEVK